MKKQESGIRNQGSDGLVKFLRKALPPIEDESALSSDLWPAMQRRMRAEAPESTKLRVPWFDWALAGGLAVMLAAFPAWIPVLLYYL
jgi:hypothetical protein